MSLDHLGAYASCTSETAIDVGSKTGGVMTLVKTIGKNEPYLSGHYPGNPVYPGVFGIDLALTLVSEAIGCVRLCAIDSVRFTRPMLPGDTVQITATQKWCAGGRKQLQCSAINRDSAKMFSMTITVEEVDE